MAGVSLGASTMISVAPSSTDFGRLVPHGRALSQRALWPVVALGSTTAATGAARATATVSKRVIIQ